MQRAPNFLLGRLSCKTCLRSWHHLSICHIIQRGSTSAEVAVRIFQGCMNNLTFGDKGMGYYETIAGGAGAGPGWHGRSGVHTHMTNTRITDPEILERRYPVVLHEFSLRPGSGGAGHWRGGDGVVREVPSSFPAEGILLFEEWLLPCR